LPVDAAVADLGGGDASGPSGQAIVTLFSKCVAQALGAREDVEVSRTVLRASLEYVTVAPEVTCGAIRLAPVCIHSHIQIRIRVGVGGRLRGRIDSSVRSRIKGTVTGRVGGRVDPCVVGCVGGNVDATFLAICWKSGVGTVASAPGQHGEPCKHKPSVTIVSDITEMRAPHQYLQAACSVGAGIRDLEIMPNSTILAEAGLLANL
jgi:hypothetical protein